MKTISLRLSDGLDEQLGKRASEQGVSKSAIVREALEAFLRNGAGREERSAYDLSADLCGVLSGPKDLSTNKKYMEDYGT